METLIIILLGLFLIAIGERTNVNHEKVISNIDKGIRIALIACFVILITYNLFIR